MKTAAPKKLKKVFTLAALGATALMLSGCGKSAFMVSSATAQQQAPGIVTVPPKVDLLLVQDDSGSMISLQSTVNSKMKEFLSSLQTKGWDYHFTSIPMTTDRAITQIMASQHDANWGTQWVAPFPGAEMNLANPGTIHPAYFTFPDQYASFVTASNDTAGYEPAFLNINKAFTQKLPGTGFLRDDALLVVLVVGNGDDTSGVTMCKATGASWSNDVPYEQYKLDVAPIGCKRDGVPVTCKAPQFDNEADTDSCRTASKSFTAYKQALQGLKPKAQLAKVYSAISKNGGTCLGSGSAIGTRSLQMATQSGGQSFDICTESVPSVLSSVAASLETQKLSFRTRYLFIDRDADETTIVVTKYPNGDTGNPIIIPQSATNGWTYLGLQENLYTIDSPALMNLRSGYAIELHGAAKLVGNDRATVEFKHKGWANTAQ